MMYFGIIYDIFSFYIKLMHKLHAHDFSVVFGLIQEWINFMACNLASTHSILKTYPLLNSNIGKLNFLARARFDPLASAI